MPQENGEKETLYGGPTKRFFVSMLTRDIELGDAILDLVDNCIDGAMRQKRNQMNEAIPFDGYFAELNISKNSFTITDNCGGIPADYIEDAFHLGRPNITKDGDLPTVGMYGIGMKRAIFKIGKSAVVQSNSQEGFFAVEYTSEWLDPENMEWDLPISRSEKKDQTDGVTINVTSIKDEIGRRFESASFLNDLKQNISEHFGYLMQRGFSVRLNGSELKPKTLVLFNAGHTAASDIRAFDFETLFDDVQVKVTIGFFRPLAKEAEVDREAESPTEAETAGISVVCNDRVVLLADRSLKTGWGDGGVPRYHPQFRAIAGLMTFTSNNAEKLPISTTKRDLDAGSDVYLTARKAAMEGLKTFTNFTNKWKGMEDETQQFFEPGKRTDVRTGIAMAASHGTSVRGSDGAKKYVPNLPLPDVRNPRRRISFIRDDGEIRIVSDYLFGDITQEPALVGAECFDKILEEAKKK